MASLLRRAVGTRSFTRGLRSAPKVQAEAGNSWLNADNTSSMLAIHHKLNLALLGLTPLAFILSPSTLNVPVDIVLGIALPIHGHIGMNMVMTDYVKKVFGKGAVGPARYVMLAFTGTTMLGLLKLNMSGPGITETVKSFWRPKEA